MSRSIRQKKRKAFYRVRCRRFRQRIGAAILVFLVGGMGGAIAWAAIENPSDAAITSALESELWYDRAVDSNNIDVETADGIVTFTGAVDNILAVERAKTIAQGTVGVRGIVNRLKVEPDKPRTDAELGRDVGEALLADPATESYKVGCSVSGGEVTLTGTVYSWQERELCATVAKGVAGVRGVQNNIEIEYRTTRPDSEIQEEIVARLRNDVRVDDYMISVEVKKGAVTLTGTVGSLAEKARARTDAWVANVRSVDADGLEIEWWTRDKMRRKSVYATQTDEEIEEAVYDAFRYDPRVFSFNPRVTVEGGTVTLTGAVSTLRAKRAAEQDTHNVTGVWRVKNNLKIRPKITDADDTTAPAAVDEDLEKKVRNALAKDPYVEAFEISVDASRGRVTLLGDVNTSFEKQQAEYVTAGVAGVKDITNALDYHYEWEWKPDWEIKADVKDQLWWSPFVNSDDISVDVDNGIVALTGAVDTWSERHDAEENAYQGGAKSVDNELTVALDYYGPYHDYSTYPWGYP